MQTTINKKGQVTIPHELREQFGLRPGMAVTFEIDGDYIKLRLGPAARYPAMSGFGLIQNWREGVPADFDAAGLAHAAP